MQTEKLDLLNSVKLLTEKVRSQQDAMEIEERKYDSLKRAYDHLSKQEEDVRLQKD